MELHFVRWIVGAGIAGTRGLDVPKLKVFDRMSDPFFRNSYNEQLTRVYVALAMVQDATRRWVNEKPEYGPLKGLVTTLEVTARMLEEILEQTLPEKADQEDQDSPELLM